ncbi:hypothetical protein TCDM_11135 [Trypanosoma cruzi Dm28c]|uniref:Uncharacterized protein n=1 Tax=Trypanosoma cruzi Dm28c TaxID=1416333 RepID=V5D1F2_TRYCR|nr:hypothetical protein TCDM_11135 [Trypanosoma cruzi Dm28c]
MGIVCAYSCVPFFSMKCSIRCTCVCFNGRAACILPLFLAVAVSGHFHATKKADKKGRKFVEHAPTASVFIHWCWPFLPGHLCALFPPLSIFCCCTGINRWAFVSVAAGCFCPRRDARNGVSSMTLGTKGMVLSPDPHRRRMPWTAEKECVPGVVRSSKEKLVLDGARRVDVECVDCASQVYPLEALRAAVNKCECNTTTGGTFLIGLSGGIQCTQAMGLLQGLAGGDA